MNIRPLALVSITLASLIAGCNKSSELDTFAEEVCACTDAACSKEVRKKFEHLPELDMKLSETESLPAEKQAALGKAMGCLMKLQTSGASSDAAPAPPPKLAEHTNAAMGYTIQLPEGFETSHEDANAGMYSFDTMMIKVDPSGVALKNPDDLLRAVNTGDGKVEKQTKGDVVMVIVDKPKMPLNIYAGPVGAKMAAHCMAEPSMRDTAIAICGSLRAKK